MPLTRVRYLVRHAAQHGYLVASFKVHGAEEVQAVVSAAEAARAPAIVAVDVPGSKALLHHDIIIAVAESVTAAASVPIAIEVVVSRQAQDDGVIITRADSSTFKQSSHAEYASRTPASAKADRWHETDLQDLEMWFPRSVAAAGLHEAAGCRVGVAAEDRAEEIVRPAAIRKHLQSCRERFNGDFVVDGDLAWPDGTFRALPGMGVVKINFDKRLGQAMAQANRQVAQRAGDHYRLAMDEVLAALADEVTDCLRRAGGTGRAADVLACALPDEKEPVRQISSGIFSEQAVPREPAEAARSATQHGVSRRIAWYEGQAAYAR